MHLAAQHGHLGVVQLLVENNLYESFDTLNPLSVSQWFHRSHFRRLLVGACCDQFKCWWVQGLRPYEVAENSGFGAIAYILRRQKDANEDMDL